MEKEQFERRKKVINDLMHDKTYVPMKIKELAMVLGVSREKRGELEAVLDELVSEGKIEVSKRGKYQIAKSHLLTGKYTAHVKGFGFVEIEGQEEDIFIPEESSGGAFEGDTVQVAVTPGRTGRRREGKIVRVLERGIAELIGTYQQSKNYGFVVPDNLKFSRDIFIPIEKSKGAVNGHKVLVKLVSYGDQNRNPEGEVVKIIGHINDPGVDILSVVYAHDLPQEFPERVLNQAERMNVPVSGADTFGRTDLRDLLMVTIDGEDAKDLDDAVSLTKDENGWHLGVHIADVANYVQENSALDREALKRGTSVYLADRVIPMLPHALSNGICSLNEGLDRLALSCLMDIDEKGNIVGHRICETVINVDRRMSYTSVKKILVDNDTNEIMKYKELVLMFHMMEEAAEHADVKIILNAVEKGSNPWGCTDYLNNKGKILGTGCSVYELMNEAAVHTKTIVVDDRMSIVGSYNWDMRSTYLDTELMLVIDSEKLNQHLREMNAEYMEKSREVLPDGTETEGAKFQEVEMTTAKKGIYQVLRVIIRPFRHLL